MKAIIIYQSNVECYFACSKLFLLQEQHNDQDSISAVLITTLMPVCTHIPYQVFASPCLFTDNFWTGLFYYFPLYELKKNGKNHSTEFLKSFG